MDISLQIGRVIQSRYIIEDILGKGEFGTAHLVRDRRGDQGLFVLKEVNSPASKESNRIPFEAVLLQKLHHHALPRVHQILQDDVCGRPYILMDFIEGTSLEVLQAEQPERLLPFHQVMSLLIPVMQALIYLHRQHPPIIHQHIKPSSIIMPRAGTGTVLVGCSLIKKYNANTITATVRYGSPGYTAPEQYSSTGRINSRTDVYALGATLYTLLTGTMPAGALYRMAELREQHPDPLVLANEIAPTISPMLAGIIHRAMSISGDERIPTVEQLLDALWQVSTLPPEDQRLPPFAVPAASVGETERVAPAGIQRVAGPGAETRAGEA